MMRLHNLFIVNKFGGLIFSKDFSGQVKLTGNDYLRVASTFHSLHGIAAQISPVSDRGGIEVIEADRVNIYCLKSLTGLMIFVTCDPEAAQMRYFLQRTYAAYADYVLKNPFYRLDQVIKSEKFEQQLKFLASDFSRQAISG